MMIELKGNNFEWDTCHIKPKRRWVDIIVYQDGCGQTYTIEKSKLKEALK